MDAESYSVGYSKDTLAKVGEMGVDLISIMSEVSDKATVSAMKMDKENVILNEEGVAVLAVNG